MPCTHGNYIINRFSTYPGSALFPPPQALQVSVEPNKEHINKKTNHDLAMQNYHQKNQEADPYFHNKKCLNVFWNETDCGNKDAIIACDGDSDSQKIKLGGCDLLVDHEDKDFKILIPRPPKKPIHISYCKDLRDQISKG